MIQKSSRQERPDFVPLGLTGDSLADRYNGSNEGERVSWTDGVTNRLSQMNSQNLQMPTACNQQQPELCDAGPGDFPTTPVAASPPPPSSTDVLVGANEV